MRDIVNLNLGERLCQGKISFLYAKNANVSVRRFIILNVTFYYF